MAISIRQEGARAGDLRLELQPLPRTTALLHVAGHVSVQHDPNEERPVDPLQLFEYIGVRYLDFHPKVLLPVDEDRLGEPEGSQGGRLSVRAESGPFRVGAGACREEPRGHLNHDLFAYIKSRDGVVDDLANQRPGSIIAVDLFIQRTLLIGYILGI